MIPYLLHVALLQAVCFLCYRILLQTETFYKLNRWVLIAGLVISFLLPLIPVPQSRVILPVQNQQVTAKTDLATANTTALSHPDQFAPLVAIHEVPVVKPNVIERHQNKRAVRLRHYSALTVAKTTVWHLNVTEAVKWLLVIYWIGVGIFGLNLLVQFVHALYQAYSKPAINDGFYRIVEVKSDIVPCSFLNSIFINPENYDWDTYSQILLHEKVHVRQLHSFDIMLLELAIVFQWFNPFIWLYRKEIENNLEYLTDEVVLLDKSIDKAAYQLSLLKVSAPHLALRITTNYNQSLLKKRILMMNAKKSNLHTLWKYFMLLPLFSCLAFALNKPLTGRSLIKDTSTNKNLANHKSVIDSADFKSFKGEVEGFWYAIQMKDSLSIDLKLMLNGTPYNYNGYRVPIKDFSDLPTTHDGNFVLKRDAGMIMFNGKFEGTQGLGKCKLKPNAGYFTFLKNEGFSNIKETDILTLLLNNVSKSLVRELKADGFTSATASQLGALDYFKVNLADLRFWGHANFTDATLQNILSAKIQNIDSNYVREMQQMGYSNLTMPQLYQLKSRGVTAGYIKTLQQASNKSSKPTIDEIISAKFNNIDSAYIHSLADVGYQLSESQLKAFKRSGVTSEYVKALRDLNYANITPGTVISWKDSKIEPEYIESFAKIGYGHIPENYVPMFSRNGVTPGYITSFERLGYTQIKPGDIIWMKTNGITPAYIQALKEIGYKEIDLSTVISLRGQEVTPEFIKGFNKLGYTDIPLNEITLLKMNGVTPEYVASMKQKGLNSKELRKYITLKNSFN